MSTGSSRFRTGRVTAPATPAERIRRHLGDDDRLVEVANEIIEPLVRSLDSAALLDVLAAIREHSNSHQVYLLHRVTASMLIAASTAIPHTPDYAWAAHYDLIPAVLMPQLEAVPAEPELLNLLGLAYYELGETPVARRLFEAIRTIDPEHAQARANLKACKQRDMRGAAKIAPVPEKFTPRSREHHAAAKRLAERAVRLPDQTISLCMIVKDEEEMLPGCLEAAAHWVDELIIVDTGSSDRTREIAAEFGAKVIDFPWTGSFSDARNRSVEDATGDWILYLDADEHMVDDDGKMLKQLARRTWIEGFYLIEHHFTGEFEMGGQTSHMALRLFRNRPNYRWTGLIHEQKMHAFPVYLPERFANTAVRINHFGYLKRVQEDRSKRERNLELLLQQLAEGSDDAFTNFNIGSEFGAMHDWPQSRPYFERALDLSREDTSWWEQQFSPMMVSRLVTARRGTGDADAALELIDESLRYWPDFTDLVFERSTIHATEGRVDEAIADARRCVEMGDAPARYVAVQGRGSFQARTLVATLLKMQGDIAGARKELEIAWREAPQFLPLVLELADVMLSTDDPDAVAAALGDQLGDRADGPHANMLLATAFYEAGHLEHGRRFYERVLEAQPANAAALIGLAELALAQHRYDDACTLMESIDPLDPMIAFGARTWFLAAVVTGRIADLDQPLGIITAAEHLPIGERSMYTAWHAALTGSLAVLPPDADAVSCIVNNLEALAKLEAVEEFEQLVPLLSSALPDERERHILLGTVYLRRHFADMAGEEFMFVAERFGPDPQVLTGLGKVATMKEMWDDAVVFLSESLTMDPAQTDARRLLDLVQERV